MALGLAVLSGCGSEGSEPTTFLDDGPPAGCVDGDVEKQRHGTACLCCHEREFGVAGSVDLGGAPITRIVVQGSAGRSAEMVPNAFGNFFRHIQLTPPLAAVIYGANGQTRAMKALAPNGDCNGCHRTRGTASVLSGPQAP
jgi:hypothetical protein